MLDVAHISKTLPDGKKLLEDVSFRVEPGDFIGVLGPSGAGKSLTMRCVLGLTQPDGGTVTLTDGNGHHCRITSSNRKQLRAVRQKIGVVFQGFNLVKRLTVLENVMIGRLGQISPLRSWLYGFTDGEAHEAMAVLERIGMASFAHRIVGTLSGGEVQRVAVARALYQNPLIVLADEPIAALDPKNANEIMRILKPISERIPICGVFHQPEITSRYCTRVIGIKDGRVVYDGSPDLSEGQLKWLYGEELDSLRKEGPDPSGNGHPSDDELPDIEKLIEG